MNKKDIFLLGGGLIAGYLICKMMTRNSEPMSFSLSGNDESLEGRAYEGKKFKFNGRGVGLTGSGQNQYYKSHLGQKYLNKSFGLTGQSKKMILSPNPNLAIEGYYETSDSPNAITFVQTTLTERTDRDGGIYRNVWLRKDSVVQI